MAEVSSYSPQLPLTPSPPPPIYPHTALRTSSPLSPGSSNEAFLAKAASFKKNSAESSARPIFRKTLSMVPTTTSDTPFIQETPSNGVIIHPATERDLPSPSSAVFEGVNPQVTVSPSDYQYRPHTRTDTIDRWKLSPSPQTTSIRPVKESNEENTRDGGHKRGHSETPLFPPVALLQESHRRSQRHVSTSALNTEMHTESYQPLQYHHKLFESTTIRPVDEPASRVTVTPPAGSVAGDTRPPTSHSQSNIRNSAHVRNLQRPDSAISSISDLRGRASSPHLSPQVKARAVSAHSASPDMRPLSYVDLLNVPYPQPTPSGAENLNNSKLRTAVGTNASLLSTRQTLEMYRANVKKTNDPAIQYEFAVFMISAAQEANLDMESLSISGLSDKSNTGIQGDMLKEARHILQRLSDRSYPFAQYYLADGYASGLFNKGKEDYDKAFPLFVAASKHGHAEAGYRTALCYEFGWGCRVEAARAIQFYQHAASKNHPGAMLRLGRACLIGDMGLGKRYREGLRWLKRAAESADFQYNSAPYELGTLHETGFGDDIFKDESYAAQLFTKSADLGHSEANYRLGDAYEHGKLNCPKDAALSVHFYTGAAQQGHPLAQMALCAWYMVGAEPVLDKDENEAYEWARKAAESGLAKAEYAIGYFTEMGIGCRRDPLEANVWYVRAADQGDERAKHRIAAIRAAATGANPVTAAAPGGKKGKLTTSSNTGNVGPDGVEKIKTKRFGLF